MSGGACVYRVFNAESVLLYVGSTTDLAQRIKQHADLALWRSKATRWEGEVFATATEARVAEMEVIATEHPRWNVRGRSDTHPDGPAVRISTIARKYPGDVTVPRKDTNQYREYIATIEPVLAGLAEPGEPEMWRRFWWPIARAEQAAA